MPTEMPEKCEWKYCIRKGVSWVAYAVRPDGSKGMWLCLKHEMQQVRNMRSRGENEH